VVEEFEWDHDCSIVDHFPAGMGVKEVAGALSAVGFSSPPSWLRPYRVLSTGEQFRVTIARALAEFNDRCVVDEFTSVVDRTVAKIASAAVEKAVRRQKRQFVAVSCHYDIIEWLRPDWIFQPHAESFEWRYLQPRPPIEIQVSRVHRKAWRLFAHHHYLSADIAQASVCYLGLIEGVPAVFCAVLAYPHPVRPGWRAHRTVCLPDFQGVGIGNALNEFVAGMYRATGKPFRSVTAHPAMVMHRARSSKWRMFRKPGLMPKLGKRGSPSLSKEMARDRMTASFEFVGEPLFDAAREFGLV